MDDVKELRKKMGELISKARQAEYMSVQELANQTGVSLNTIQGIEKGRFAWNIDLHIKICAALGRSPLSATHQ